MYFLIFYINVLLVWFKRYCFLQALDVVIDAVMCKLCTANLETAYDFKVKCLQTEEQLRTLLQSSGRSQIDFNELLQRQRLVVPKTVIVIQRPAVKQYRPALRKRRR